MHLSPSLSPPLSPMFLYKRERARKHKGERCKGGDESRAAQHRFGGEGNGKSLRLKEASIKEERYVHLSQWLLILFVLMGKKQSN